MASFSKTSVRCNYSAKVSPRKITRDEVVSLKSAGTQRVSSSRRAIEVIGSYLQGLMTLISTPVQKDRNVGMCANYGHVIQGAWKGQLPCCRDCGIKINSPDMLRKAVPVR